MWWQILSCLLFLIFFQVFLTHIFCTVSLHINEIIDIFLGICGILEHKIILYIVFMKHKVFYFWKRTEKFKICVSQIFFFTHEEVKKLIHLYGLLLCPSLTNGGRKQIVPICCRGWIVYKDKVGANAQWIIADFSPLTHTSISMIF